MLLPLSLTALHANALVDGAASLLFKQAMTPPPPDVLPAIPWKEYVALASVELKLSVICPVAGFVMLEMLNELAIVDVSESYRTRAKSALVLEMLS